MSSLFRRAEQHDVLRLQEEPSGREPGDLLPSGRLGVPVEVLERLAGGEPGGFDPQLRARSVPGGDLSFEDRGEVVLERPARIPRQISYPAGRFSDPGCFERASEIGDLLDRLGLLGHHATSSILNARS